MASKRHKAEEIITKLCQVDVLLLPRNCNALCARAAPDGRDFFG